MMKKYVLSLCALLAMAGSTRADDAFSVDDVSLPVNAEAGLTVRFSLDEGSTCSGYTFWLQLPEEVEAVTNASGNIDYTLGDSYDAAPVFTPNMDGGYLKVACLNANSDPLNKQQGTLVTFRLRLKEGQTVSVGDVLSGKLLKGVISAENGSIHDVADDDFTITIAEAADLRTLLDETSTTVPTAAEGVDVRVKRTIKAGEWSTICLPFAMTAEQVKAAFGEDVELGDFNGTESEIDDADKVVGITARFGDVTAIEANHPYIIKVSKAISEFTVDGVDVTPEEDEAYIEFDNGKSGSRRVVYSGFYGTYHADTVLDEFTLFLSDNKFWYSTGLTRMKAFRAYFAFLDVLTEVEEAGAPVYISFGGDTTRLDLMNIDGEDSNYYDLNGRVVKTPQHGVYIKNGKKVIVK